jgi:hypothetical protein
MQVLALILYKQHLTVGESHTDKVIFVYYARRCLSPTQMYEDLSLFHKHVYFTTQY